MTGNPGRPDIGLLADLDAGLLDEATAREVRAAAAEDPAAGAVLEALAATRAELAALPDPPVPPALAARWSAALAAEQAAHPANSDTAPTSPPTASPIADLAGSAADPAREGVGRPSAGDAAPAHAIPPAATSPAATPGPTTSTSRAPAEQDVRMTTQPTSHPMRALRTPPAGCEETEGVRSPASAVVEPPNSAATPHPDAALPSATSAPADPRGATPAHRGPRRAVPLEQDPRGATPDRGPRRATPGEHDPRADTSAGRRGPRARGHDASPSPGRRPTARRLVPRPAVLAAALLVAVAVVAGLRARGEPPPTVERPRLVAEALSAVGIRDTAGLTDPARRAGCLRAVGAPVERPDAPLLGGRRVTFEGDEGVLLVLGTGQRGTFDVLIVDPDCGPSGGKLLLATRVTPR